MQSDEGPPPASSLSPADHGAQVQHRLGRLLDNLEQYQQLLGDRHVSLKAVAPAVDRLKGDMTDLTAMLDHVGGDHPLKPLLNEALVIATKEVSRFESGDYVDGA